MKRGRPRSFDPDAALDRAMEVFWRKGFAETSLSDLTEAMGINRPSLYAAFGDKEALFCKVLDRYAEGPASYFACALEAPTARAVAEAVLTGAAVVQTNRQTPPGCLTVHGALSCGDLQEPVGQELLARRAKMHSALTDRLIRAKAEGDLPPDADPESLSRYLETFVAGMAVMAGGGTSRKELTRMIGLALAGWPNGTPGR